MRMWMLPTAGMCRKHLLGEHVELHMLLGSLRRGKNIEVLPGFPWVTPVRNWPGRGLDRHRRSRWLS